MLDLGYLIDSIISIKVRVLIMNLIKYCFILISLLLATTLAFATTVGGNYNRIIVFGDSYSDNGNVFKLTNGKYPNAVRYFRGRFSDGPVWSEYFARNFGINPNDKDHFIKIGRAHV